MNNTEFLKKYRKNKQAVWIKVALTNGKEFYFSSYKPNWQALKKVCETTSSFIKEFELQFRSNVVSIDIPKDVDAVYLIRSVLGQMGGESKQYYTVGTIKGETVNKDMYLVPELIKEKSYKDNIESCFEEGIIYDDRKEKKENG